jgi:antitoxin component YwqK of YwqJK toxin-antitoxin module
MNTKITSIKIFTSCLFLLLISCSSFAQKVDSVVIDSKQYYVYPFNVKVKHKSKYEYCITRKEYFKAYKNHFEQLKNKKLDKIEVMMHLYGEEHDYFDYAKRIKHKNKKYRKGLKKNPLILLTPKYQDGKDLMPCLDKIPDGQYIQYFEDYIYVNEKGKVVVQTKHIAAYFTIKNNALEGEAFWLGLMGDTLKQGTYNNGLKNGEWHFIEKSANTYSYKKYDKIFKKTGHLDVDTTQMIVTFKQGSKNGVSKTWKESNYPIIEGEFTENKPTGTWVFRDKPPYFYKEGKEYVKFEREPRDNSVITKTFTYSQDTTATKVPYIRKKMETPRNSYLDTIHNFNPRFDKPTNFTYNFHEIAKPKDNQIDEDIESDSWVPGYDDEMYYNEEEYSDELNYELNYDNYYLSRDKKNKLVDSLGIRFKYTGIYEETYPNGQLMFRFEIKDGQLIEEDTIYWDNGIPFDVVTYVADSNHYHRMIYDYNGLHFSTEQYDSLGHFEKYIEKKDDKEYIFIDGLKALVVKNRTFFSHDSRDTLDHHLDCDSVVLWKSWGAKDTTTLYNRVYFPHDRTFKIEHFSCKKELIYQKELVFAENFETYTGSSEFNFYNFKLIGHHTALLNENEKEKIDTIPQRYVQKNEYPFDITDDFTLYQNGIPFSGDVHIEFTKKKFQANTKKALELSLPARNRITKKLARSYKKFKKGKEGKYHDLLGSLDENDFTESMQLYLFHSLFPEISAFLEREDYRTSNLEIVGHMVAGKPDQMWYLKRNGKTLCSISYSKGELNGEVKYYAIAYPEKKKKDTWGRDDFSMPAPKKKTEYLAYVENYKNGMLDGACVGYNWQGTVLSENHFKNGLQEGISIERNRLAYSESHYANNELDGYVKTYLTLPEKDSIQLFALNFQNGMLQGESKSFHVDGKIAKKGFFLNGLPIDDYEGYDTLGKLYHYVKFEYSFPVEEKIWEENQLSVRYTFDWKDSIEFRPINLTKTESLDRLLYKLGFGREDFEKPYYGRPSLINKRDLKYHMTKYYPNDTIARDGDIKNNKKIGEWKFFDYYGKHLYDINYFDSTIVLEDSLKFRIKGIYTALDSLENPISKSYIIERFEKYDCSHNDHYETRQFITFWQDSSYNFKNNYVQHFYDNGVLQSEGNMEDGLPVGVWKFYDPFGKINQVGEYVKGKKNGRWLAGDLSKTKYLGNICLNPNMPDLEEEIKSREKMLDITIISYKMGKSINKEFYDIDWSNVEEEEQGESLEE